MLQLTIIHYSSFPHSVILKLHHFCCPKHISISFFISHTKSPFLESNITNVIIQKTISTTTFTTFNLHLSISYFHLFYKTHSSQNTHTYFSYISKLHVSQIIHIQDPCPYTYSLSSPRILKQIKHASKNLLLKALSCEKQKLIKSKSLLMEGNITYIWLKTKRVLHGESHLSVWWKGINLTNLCTRLDILSLSPVAPIFPLQSWSHHGMTHNIILYRWTNSIMLLKCLNPLLSYDWSPKPWR